MSENATFCNDLRKMVLKWEIGVEGLYIAALIKFNSYLSLEIINVNHLNYSVLVDYKESLPYQNI